MAEVELMVKQDTGWRNIASLIPAATWTVELARLRRTGNVCVLEFAATCLATTPNLAWSIPAGFRDTSSTTPPFMQIWRGLSSWNPKAGLPLLVRTRPSMAGNILFSNQPVATDYVQFSLTWLADDAFPLPAAYPGTPA